MSGCLREVSTLYLRKPVMLRKSTRRARSADDLEGNSLSRNTAELGRFKTVTSADTLKTSI